MTTPARERLPEDYNQGIYRLVGDVFVDVVKLTHF